MKCLISILERGLSLYLGGMRNNIFSSLIFPQKDTAGGKRAINAWYWMVVGEAYDANH